jgi:hypothetical protein
MSRFKSDPSSHYRETVYAIQNLINDEGLEEARAAVSEALEDPLREFFLEEFDVEKVDSGEKCIARLIGGYEECPHRKEIVDELPHRPPYDDHSELWHNDGRPIMYTMHLYSVNFEKLTQIHDFTQQHGLKLWVAPASWYNATGCVQFQLCAPEWFNQRFDLS